MQPSDSINRGALHASVRRALRLQGIVTWQDLAAHSRELLLTYHGVTRARLVALDNGLLACGLTFAVGAQGRRPALSLVERTARSVTPVVGGVYFIRSREYVKIGRATDVYKRLNELQVAVPWELELCAIISCSRVAARAIESALHLNFRALCVRGEWFREEPPLRQYLSLLPRAA
jgi:hypothetical protein